MHHGFLFLFCFFSFLKCPVEDGVQRNSAALENGGKSAPRPILMFIRVSCVFGPDHKQNKKTRTDLSICPGSLLGLLAMTEGGLKPQRNHRFRRAQNPTHRILRVSITETSWAPLCSYQKHPCLAPTPGAPRPARGVCFFGWHVVLGSFVCQQLWPRSRLVVLQHLPGCERCRRCARLLCCVSGVAQRMATTSSCMLTGLIMLGYVVGPLCFAQRQPIDKLCMLVCTMRLAASA